jgi:hypothetical protein
VVAEEGWVAAVPVAASSEPRTKTAKYHRTDEGRRGRKWTRLETVFYSQLKAHHCGNFHSYSLLTQDPCIWTTWSIYIVVALTTLGDRAKRLLLVGPPSARKLSRGAVLSSQLRGSYAAAIPAPSQCHLHNTSSPPRVAWPHRSGGQ